MMKLVIALAFVAAVASAATNLELFQQFMTDYNKVYPTEAEKNYRFTVFEETLARNEKLNADEPDKPFGINEFADMTPKEFSEKYLMNKLQFAKVRAAQNKDAIPELDLSQYSDALPTSFNWATNTSVVTPVKNQGQCGSCWAFSATENIESVWALAGNKLISLAPQQIVDCDTTDAGCNGGDTITAYEYVIKAGGLELETSYPYTAKDGTCKAKASLEVAKITGYSYATKTHNETAMQVATYNEAPLSICVDAVTWQTYTHGIITSNCGNSLDHCVQITGWNVQGSTNYWIIRNSWGTSWGNAGYIYVEIGKNLCGVSDEATTTEAK